MPWRTLRTDITVLITTDFDCKDLHHVTVAVGTLGAALETAPPTTLSTYARTGATWSQQAHVKASNTRSNALFGTSAALSGDTLAVGSDRESSGGAGIDGNQADTSAPGPAVRRTSSPGAASRGRSKRTSQGVERRDRRLLRPLGGARGRHARGGVLWESSGAMGVNVNQADTSAMGAGSMYVLR
jgi:hypothetical protein